MSQAKALLWKEWHEVRAFLALALCVFLVLPLIGAVEGVIGHLRFELSASVWIALLGGPFAVFVGVGTVVRDLEGRLEAFWRSRPVGAGRWLLVKYLVGLAVVLAGLAVPLIAEILVNHRRQIMGADARAILAWAPFFWSAMYSIAFAAACLVRRGAHAAMVSIAALLLVYFLPQVIPPLKFLSIGQTIDASQYPRRDHNDHLLSIYRTVFWTPFATPYEPRQLAFAAGMLVVCALGLWLAITAVRREWRVESGRRTIYWSIGGALLILFASAAVQVGSNLPLLQTVEVPVPPAYLQEQLDIRSAGSHGVLILEDQVDDPHARTVLRPFGPSPSDPSTLAFGPDLTLQGRQLIWSWMVIHPEHPDIAYIPQMVSTELDEDDFFANERERYPTLTTIAFRGSSSTPSVQSFPKLIEQEGSAVWGGIRAFVQGDRLYLVGSHLMIFDIGDPLKPRLVSTRALVRPLRRDINRWRLLSDPSEDVDAATIALPSIPEISARQRLACEVTNYAGRSQMSGDILVHSYSDGHITTYRLEQLTDDAATFRKVGRYDPTPMQRLLGRWAGASAVGDGLFYESLQGGTLGGAHVEVFDITGSRPVPVGHFALPGETYVQTLYPLAAGRVLAATSTRLYLLGPPRGH